jgi:NAD(P)-dependent dehydrogenase (short-subunit alcohol dehydrogenase family)
MPPGDTAYNVSKAGVKVLTEGLQHSLRSRDGCKVNAFLLVPGWTITMIVSITTAKTPQTNRCNTPHRITCFSAPTADDRAASAPSDLPQN